MQKTVPFSKWEMIFVIVNSVITKLFLLYPKALIEKGSSGSLLLCAAIIIVGLLIYLIIIALYKKFDGKSIIKILRETVGNGAAAFIAVIIAVFFLCVNGIFLRSVSESVQLSLLPETPISVISLFFIAGICIAVFTGIKSVIRCHSIIVPLTLAAAVILYIAAIPHFKLFRVFPVMGEGIASLAGGIPLCSFFADFLVFLLLMPHMKRGVGIGQVMLPAFAICAAAMVLIISAVLLTVETDTVIPVFRLAQNISGGGSSARLESIFTIGWFLSFFLNLSLLLYYSCRLTAGAVGRLNINRAIIPMGFIVLGISILPDNPAVLAKYFDCLSLGRLIIGFALPIVILSAANIKEVFK